MPKTRYTKQQAERDRVFLEDNGLAGRFIINGRLVKQMAEVIVRIEEDKDNLLKKIKSLEAERNIWQRVGEWFK
jgi:hypothetical protein